MTTLLSVALLVVAAGATMTVGQSWVAAADATKAYVPVIPTRFMDTRVSLGGGRFNAGESRTLQISGRSPVPASGAVAVTLNVTVTEPDAPGYLTVWPSGQDRPLASNLNYVAGETTPNMVVVGLGAGGAATIFAQSSTDVVVDVVGWFYAGFNPVTPARLMDTREGLGGLVLGPGERRDLAVQGRGGLPNQAVGAVALNVTVTEPTSAGFLTVWPTGVDQPLASSLNFVAGDTTPNAVIVGVGSGGKITLFNSSGNTQVIVDLAGWVASGFDAVTPSRLMDTREGLGGVVLAPRETRNLKVIGIGDIPASRVGAVSLNVTVTEPSASGFLTVWPAGVQQPVASNLNFVPDQTVPNAVIVGVGANGEISIFNSAGNSQVIVDVTGWYALSDSTAPEIVALSLSPSSVNTSGGAQTITVTARLTDDLSGVSTGNSWSLVDFRGPSGQQVSAWLTPAERVSGTALDGVYSSSMIVPAFAESGTWTVGLMTLFDGAGNRRALDAAALTARGLPTTFVQSGQGDSTAPEIVALSLSPSSVNTSGGAQTITVTARLTDDLSGVSTGNSWSLVYFRSPSGQQVSAWLTPNERVSGTALDGVYSSPMIVPAFAESGTWTVSQMTLFDGAGNRRALDAAALTARGLPTTFTNN